MALKVFIATARWSDHYMSAGTKIIIEEFRAEAERILKEWTEKYLEGERQNDEEYRARIEKDLREETDKNRQEYLRRVLSGSQKNPDLILEWDIEERPLEKGILWQDTVQWLSETP